MIVVNCDGAIEDGGNPGGHGVGGWIIQSIDPDDFYESREILSIGNVDLGKYPELSSNIVEYTAVLYALYDLLDRNIITQEITVLSDSLIIINQLNGLYSCNSPHLLVLRNKIFKLCEQFKENLTFTHIRREYNYTADMISRLLY